MISESSLFRKSVALTIYLTTT